MEIQCNECKYKDNFKKFLLSKETKIVEGRSYTKEKYQCPSCNSKEETDWLIDE